MILHKLTVNGKDYFLDTDAATTRAQILDALRSGGDYVRIPRPKDGRTTHVLISAGVSVTWTEITVTDPPASAGSDGRDDDLWLEL